MAYKLLLFCVHKYMQSHLLTEQQQHDIVKLLKPN